MNKKVLIIAAHPDDETLGCGGTIAKLTKNGSKVHVAFLADGESSREDKTNIKKLISERKNISIKALKSLGCKSVSFFDYADQQLDSVNLLEVVKLVEKLVKKYQPHTIFTHYMHDLNIDHQITHKAVVTACRPQPNHCVKELFFFEVPSSTEWNISKGFMPNYFVDISKTISQKKRALNIYKKEMRPFPHTRSIKAIESLALFRGSSVGVKAAEAFIIGRKIEN